MSHTAGLPSWSEPVTVDVLYDWDQATSLLAAQEPWWEPGTASGLPRHHPGLSRGRARSAGHRPDDRRVRRRRDRRAARRRLPHRHRRRARRPGRPRDPAEPPVAAPTTSSQVRSSTGWSFVAPRRRCRQHDPVAACRDPRLRWVRQRPLGRPAPRADGVRRRSQRRAAAVAVGADPAFDEQMYGPDLILPMKSRHGIGFGLPSPETAAQPQPAGLLLGRLGRIAGRHRPRRQDDVRLRDEQDGRRHDRRPARPPTILAALYGALA